MFVRRASYIHRQLRRCSLALREVVREWPILFSDILYIINQAAAAAAATAAASNAEADRLEGFADIGARPLQAVSPDDGAFTDPLGQGADMMAKSNVPW